VISSSKKQKHNPLLKLCQTKNNKQKTKRKEKKQNEEGNRRSREKQRTDIQLV
jgi:hypothetical protein